jgi:hypothetical protein
VKKTPSRALLSNFSRGCDVHKKMAAPAGAAKFREETSKKGDTRGAAEAHIALHNGQRNTECRRLSKKHALAKSPVAGEPQVLAGRSPIPIGMLIYQAGINA